MLFQFGPIVFDVYPLNTHAWDQTTATEFARKDVAGMLPPREWVGEDDEEIVIHGRLFPYAIGGLSEIEALDALRAEGKPQNLVRGDGYVLGWYNLERLFRGHTFVGPDGVGQVIDFEAMFLRAEAPRAADWFSSLYRMIT